MIKRAASAAFFIYTENVLGSQRGVSMKIIYIHGMNKQKFSSASTLAQSTKIRSGTVTSTGTFCLSETAYPYSFLWRLAVPSSFT